MLTYEIMGWVALWVLWGNTALVALAAARRALALLGRARVLAEAATAATIVRGDGPGGALCELEIEQVGRLGAGGVPRIVFHDRAHRSKVFGGEVELPGGARVTIAPTDHAEVWPDEDEVRRAAACPSAATFDEALVGAKKARGFVNLVRVPFESGRAVTIAGRRAARAGDEQLVATEGDTLVLAASPPGAQAYRRALLVLVGFVPAVFAVAAIATRLALTAPLFESALGKLGAALGVAHFLLVLPAGTAVRDFMRLPFERFVRGSWDAPSGAAERALG